MNLLLISKKQKIKEQIDFGLTENQRENFARKGEEKKKKIEEEEEECTSLIAMAGNQRSKKGGLGFCVYALGEKKQRQ